MDIAGFKLPPIARLTILFLSLALLQCATPATDRTAFSASKSFALVPIEKSISAWAQLKLAANSIDKFVAKVKSNKCFDFNNTPRKFKIVKVISKRQSSHLSWPVSNRITSGFGMRRHPITKKRSFHNGIDIKGRRGTKVKAPADGVVVSAGRAGLLGRLVRIKTSNGLLLYFGHLHRYKCRKGQKVKRGQLIGTIGSSGRATGPHLHFAVKYNNKYMNPISYLSAN